MQTEDARALVAEGLGTALLLVAVVGSGIMGERLSDGNVAIALLANSIATGAALVVLILTFGPTSGAHFNPVVSLADATQGGISWPTATRYIVAQVSGAFAGVAVADLMFDERVFAASRHVRAGWALALGELVATFGLLSVIWSCSRRRAAVVPFAVGTYITAAYWFTSSTSFANPAVTLARAATDTFAGIRPADVPAFLAAQALGAAAATTLFRWLVPALPRTAVDVVVPHVSTTRHGVRVMAEPRPSVLILCTGNSARSQMAEAILRHLSDGQIDVQSAGTAPQPDIHPMARRAVKSLLDLDMDGQYPKVLDRFLHRDFDYVITVCDRAAETCPVFPGHPERIHWSVEDPAAVVGTDAERQRAFDETAQQLLARLRLWLSVPGIRERIGARA